MNLDNTFPEINPYTVVLSVIKVNGGWETEALLCQRKNDLFELAKPPFYARQLAVGDLLKAEFSEEDGSYYTDHKIESSGNSTIQLQCHKLKFIREAREQLMQMGCACEINYTRNRIAVHIPKEVDYNNVRFFLKTGESDNRWNVEESCIAHLVNSSARPCKPADLDMKVKVWLLRLGRNLQQLRTDRYESLEQLSKATDIPVAILQNVERGKGAALEIGHFLKLINHCGIEPKKAFH